VAVQAVVLNQVQQEVQVEAVDKQEVHHILEEQEIHLP